MPYVRKHKHRGPKALNLSGKPGQVADKDLSNSSVVPTHNVFQTSKLLSKLAFIITSPAATGKAEPYPSLLTHFSKKRFRSLEDWWYLSTSCIKLYLNSLMFPFSLGIKMTFFYNILLFLWTCFPLISGCKVLSIKASLQSLKKDLLWYF